MTSEAKRKLQEAIMSAGDEMGDSMVQMIIELLIVGGHPDAAVFLADQHKGWPIQQRPNRTRKQ